MHQTEVNALPRAFVHEQPTGRRHLKRGSTGADFFRRIGL